MKKKYFIIAGESSGDEHGSLLMKEMIRLNENIIFDGIGGKKWKIMAYLLFII